MGKIYGNKKNKLKMYKFFSIILTTFFLISYSKAEVVKKVEINGNQRVSDATIKIYGDIKINKDYSEKDLNDILNNLYSTNFFKDITINLSNNILKINLEEFPTVSKLIILGEEKERILKQIKKLMKLKENVSYSRNKLSDDINLIKQLYSSIGYNFAEVQSKINETGEGNIELLIEIKKGNLARISKINFVGDKKVREKRLRDIIASEEHKFYKIISKNTNFSQNLINLDTRLLRNYYKSIGYYDVNITSSTAEVKDSGDINLTYSIDAGTRYIFKKITTNVDPVFDKNIFYPLRKEYNKIIGSYYSPFKIKELLESIDELIADNNLQFVEHNVEEIIENDGINIKFNIFEGKRILVERINIIGNNITNESVIRGELELDEGDPYTKLGLEKSISNLKSRNLFKTVDYQVKDGTSGDLKVVDIKIEEKPTGEISAGAGIGTNGSVFAFTLKENNYLGDGNTVAFDFTLSEDAIKGRLDFTNPNYDLLGNSVNYYITSTSNDKPDQGFENTISGAGISTSFEQFRDIYASLGVSIDHDDLQTTSGASDSLKKQSGTFSTLSTNYGFTYDKRNRRFMPTDGFVTSFNQTLPIYADKAFIANTFSSSLYNKINENVIGAAKFYVSAINGINNDDVRISKRRSLSTTRLRGFESGKVGPVDGSDHIGGNYSAAINFEASMPNLLPESTNTDIGIFLDIGNVWGVDYDDTIDDSNEIRSSTGVAASWLSPLGPMTFILSTNISKASTDTTESFNFNLGTTF